MGKSKDAGKKPLAAPVKVAKPKVDRAARHAKQMAKKAAKKVQRGAARAKRRAGMNLKEAA